MHLLALYLLLIAFFYENTDGFNSELSPFRYTVLKTLPVLSLSLAVLLGHGSMKGVRRNFLGGALLAGACGDFLISVCRDMELSFALSAIVFGIGHVLYMAGFLPDLKNLSPKLTTCTVFYALFMNIVFLLPNFGAHPITTTTLVAYSLVLSVSLATSGSLVFEGTQLQAPRQKNNVMRFVGYSLFFISDSLLLLEKANLEIPSKEALILSTYYAAQYLIMSAAIETEQLV